MITVFIVDDHYMVVEGIHTLLQNQEDIDVIGHASTLASARAFLRSRRPDVLLLDVSLPDGNGIDLCTEVHKEYPEVGILALSTFNQKSYIRSMSANGASGYLLKNATSKEMSEAIRTVKAGGTYFSFEAAKTLQAGQTLHRVVVGKREKEVLELIAHGHTNSEIAVTLGLSVNTVDTYRKSLVQKFQAKNTADLVRIALQQGIIGS